MDFKTQILILLIDKLIVGGIILGASLFVNRSLEAFKNDIVRKNKLHDKTFEKMSFVIEKIWATDRAFNKMLADYAKTEALGPFQCLSDINDDPSYKAGNKDRYVESASSFSASVSELVSIVDVSAFWLGPNLSLKAKEIADAYYALVFSIIDNDKDKKEKAGDLVQMLPSMIKAFEAAALEYIE